MSEEHKIIRAKALEIAISAMQSMNIDLNPLNSWYGTIRDRTSDELAQQVMDNEQNRIVINKTVNEYFDLAVELLRQYLNKQERY